jgi:hypothetical protein
LEPRSEKPASFEIFNIFCGLGQGGLGVWAAEAAANTVLLVAGNAVAIQACISRLALATNSDA